MEIENKRPPYFINVGELSKGWLVNHIGFPTADRKWESCIANKCITAGQGEKWSSQLRKLEVGDFVIAFITERGYVGIGMIASTIKHVKDFEFIVNPLQFGTNIFLHADTKDKAEYVVGVDWIEDKIQPKEKAFWEKNIGLFAKQHIVASLANQQNTIDFIEAKFKVKFKIR